MSQPAAASAVDRYVKQFEGATAARTGEPEFMRTLRQMAIDRFASRGFPTRREEDWRFTDVAAVAALPVTAAAPSRNGVRPDNIAALSYGGTRPIVVQNGIVARDLSRLDDLPDGLTVARLADALADHGTLLEQHLAQHARFDQHPFIALNTALMSDAVVVMASPGAQIAEPLHIVSLTSGGGAVAGFARVLVVASEGSALTVIETHASTGTGPYFTCPVSEIVVGANATVDHYKIQADATDAFHIGALQALLNRDSRFVTHSISTGGALVRHDVNGRLDGEGAHAMLNGLYVVQGTQFVDTHMVVEHLKPRGTSYELYKGILDGQSRAVFNGRIYVAPGAQVTDGVQSNRNLLLSAEALVNSNPQLEIFADDVRCTHGSTVGQLDPEAIYYLRSRGIGEAAARSLLVYAFAREVVDTIAFEPVRDALAEFLFQRLPRGEIVRQAV